MNDDFELQTTLGFGTFGTVSRAKRRKLEYDTPFSEPSRSECAIKISYNDSEGCPISVLREISTLKRIGCHANVVELCEVWQLQTRTGLVMDPALYDLKTYLKNNGCMNIQEAKFLMSQLCSGCEHIHRQGFVHRDLKPANVLVYSNTNLRICDFGQARWIDPYDDERCYSLHVGTTLYEPIDVLLGNDKYSFEYDIWSLGCIFYEMIRGKLLFVGSSQIEVIFQIISKLGKIDPVLHPSIINLQYYDNTLPACKPTQLFALPIVQEMLQYEPSLRPSASTCLQRMSY